MSTKLNKRVTNQTYGEKEEIKQLFLSHKFQYRKELFHATFPASKSRDVHINRDTRALYARKTNGHRV